jgi:hypothetical protein
MIQIIQTKKACPLMMVVPHSIHTKKSYSQLCILQFFALFIAHSKVSSIERGMSEIPEATSCHSIEISSLK